MCVCLYITVTTCIPLVKEPGISYPPARTNTAHQQKTHTHQSHNTNCSSHQGISQSKGPKACSIVPSTRQLDEENTQTRTQKRKKQAKIDFSHLFREDSDQYPDEDIRVALKQTSEHLKELFNVLNTPLDPNVNLTERIAHHADDDLYNRDGSREESICRSVIRNIYPREAKRENSLVYIPNNQDFMQVIQAEICQYPNEECSYLADNLPFGMSSVCHQKYAYKKLLYLDSLEKRMASDLFPYPSCCSCHVKILPLDLRSLSNSSSSINHEGSARLKTSNIDKMKVNDTSDTKLEMKYNLPLEENSEFIAISQSENGESKIQNGSTSKRQAKALTTTGLDVSSIVISEEAKQIQVHKVMNKQNKHEDRNSTIIVKTTHAPSLSKKIAKQTTQPTIVLLEDKVYTPGL